MENQQSGYESYWKEAGMVTAFHSKAVSHGKNAQATNSRAGTVTRQVAKQRSRHHLSRTVVPRQVAKQRSRHHLSRTVVPRQVAKQRSRHHLSRTVVPRQVAKQRSRHHLSKTVVAFGALHTSSAEDQLYTYR